ncbi:MAG TPA: histidinol dehydrogenase, partial [Acidimicrobiales bacterium]|nr:histidinol dehydrogenase [Acidimicrobiales bacterium]
PPGPDGFPPVESLAAAAIAGVDQVFRIGGAQAIASMAFGTKSVPAVDVVVGPGNIYVSLAKQELAGIVSVPGAFAGPSEVVVVADASTDPLLAAVDLAVQAEHGPDGLAWLVTWSPEAVGPICEALAQVVEKSPRRVDLESTLSAGGFVAIVDGPDKAVEVINEIAPEHLEILLSDPEEVLRGVANAGAIFVGMNTPASVGDYVAGPSHVLPTNGTARFAGALSVVDFTKEMSVVKVSPEAIESVAGDVSIIALAEGLDAHSQSVLMRLPALETQSGASLDMGASNLNLVQGEDHG